MNLFTLKFLIVVVWLIVSGSRSSISLKWRESEYIDDLLSDSLSRNALRNTEMLWPNGTVYFKIHVAFSDDQAKYILRAMRMIQSISCVRFVRAPSNATTFLGIRVSQKACHSNIGYKEGIRNMYLTLDELGTGCFQMGSILHELMHVLGFIDQHQVPDRDNYIKVLYENVNDYERSHFHNWRFSRITNMSIPYDFGSIMHPPINLFSKNGKRTIEPIVDPGDVIIGQRKGLSKMDALKLNRLYKCCS